MAETRQLDAERLSRAPAFSHFVKVADAAEVDRGPECPWMSVKSLGDPAVVVAALRAALHCCMAISER